MKTRVLLLVVVLASSALSIAAHQARPAGTPLSIDEVLDAYRADLQANRAEIIRKNVPMSREQADRFWPMFERYEKEQSAIMDAQLRGIQNYILNSATMDDAAALALMQAHLDRDANMAALRRQWLGEFVSVLPTKLAVRMMQIDRRISLAQQTEFTAQIPLAQ
jgi:hypothetical protein